jgi:hypothetical protein
MPRPRPSGEVRWLTVLLAATAGICLAACSTSPSAPIPSSSPSVTPTSPAATSAANDSLLAPLTNLPVASAAAADAPAVAVDVSGTNPVGLGSADVVFEEITAPTVRYIAVFQSKSASAVGPVTSTQAADGDVLAVLHPLVGYDGGSPTSVSILHKSGVIDAGQATYPSLYSSGASGTVVSTQALASAVKGGTTPPPLFRYRGSSTGATTLATSGVSTPTAAQVIIPGVGTQDWGFDAQSDLWQLNSGGPQVSVANLVVQTVPYKNDVQRGGVTVPIAKVLGSGRVEVLSAKAGNATGGTAASGTWSKPNSKDVTNYLDASSSPMAFQPGVTWVILVPPGTQVSTSG